MKIKNIDSLIYILNDNFSNFFDKKLWSIKKQSNNFNYIDDLNNELNNNILSTHKLLHQYYNIILPHELSLYINNDSFNESHLDIIFDKYNRRINRFRDIIKNDSPKIFYIGINKINNNDKKKIIQCLKDYGCINYHIKFIEYDNYLDEMSNWSWKRDWLPNILFI